MHELYKNIKKLRVEKGMSQSELAKLTGYTDRSSIAKIEKGIVDLNQSKIKRFAKALNVSPSMLMGSQYDEKPESKVGKLTLFEEDLILAYRSAPESRKEAVRALLDVNKKGKEETAPVSSG